MFPGTRENFPQLLDSEIPLNKLCVPSVCIFCLFPRYVVVGSQYMLNKWTNQTPSKHFFKFWVTDKSAALLKLRAARIHIMLSKMYQPLKPQFASLLSSCLLWNNGFHLFVFLEAEGDWHPIQSAPGRLPFIAWPKEPAKLPSQQLIKAVLTCFCESFNRCLYLNPVQSTFHSLLFQISPQIKRHVPEKVKQYFSLLVCPQFYNSHRKAYASKANWLSALPAISAIVCCSVLSRSRHTALEGMLPQLILPAHKGRMSFPLLGCFSQVFIAIVLHVPPRLKRFLSSCAVCLEGWGWSAAAKSLEKREGKDLILPPALARRLTSCWHRGWIVRGHWPLTCSLSHCLVWDMRSSSVDGTPLGNSVVAKQAPNVWSIRAVVFNVKAKFSMAWKVRQS